MSKKEKDKSEKRERKAWSEFPDGKRPTSVGLNEFMETTMLADAEKHKRNLKDNLEYIIDQYCKGNIRIRVEGTNLWYGIDTPAEEIDKIQQVNALNEQMEQAVSKAKESFAQLEELKQSNQTGQAGA